MDDKSPLPPLRGLAKSVDVSDLPPPWEKVDRMEKIRRSIDSMLNPKFIRKRGKASGEEALLLRIGKEEGLAQEIANAPGAREAIIQFITNLYRSENTGVSWQNAERARKLFALTETPEESTTIRDAQLDCIAYAMFTYLGESTHRNEWLEGLTDAEKAEVERRKQHYRL